MKKFIENAIANYLIVCWIAGIYVITKEILSWAFIGINKLIEKIAIARKRRHIMNQRVKENNGELV